MLLSIAAASSTISYCNTGCPSSQAGDGICQPDCMNSNCQYDGGDCANRPYCAPACSPAAQYDFNCDDLCNTPSCDYDNFRCLCGPGCLPSMLGDGFCDPSCYLVGCNLDGGDCDPCTVCANGGVCSIGSNGAPRCTCPQGSCDLGCRTLAGELGERPTGSCGVAWDNCNRTMFGNPNARFCCKSGSVSQCFLVSSSPAVSNGVAASTSGSARRRLL
jgi:LNR domain